MTLKGTYFYARSHSKHPVGNKADEEDLNILETLSAMKTLLAGSLLDAQLTSCSTSQPQFIIVTHQYTVSGVKPAWKVLLPPSATAPHKTRWHVAPSPNPSESLAPWKQML